MGVGITYSSNQLAHTITQNQWMMLIATVFEKPILHNVAFALVSFRKSLQLNHHTLTLKVISSLH